MNNYYDELRKLNHQTSEDLPSIFRRAKEKAASMQADSPETAFCVTNGVVIAKGKNNATNGYNCWLELVAYWDEQRQAGRLKFIPLMSNYFFGDTALPDEYVEQIINHPSRCIGRDTIIFTEENQPPKLKLSPSAIKQFCAVESAAYAQGRGGQLTKFNDSDVFKYIDDDGIIFENITPPAFPDEPIKRYWNHYLYAFSGILEWKEAGQMHEALLDKVEYEAFVEMVPAIWLAAPKDSCFMLTLAGRSDWEHGNYEYITQNSCDRVTIEYIQSSPKRKIWNYIKFNRFER